MPTYAYVCDKCSHKHEEFRSILRPHPKKCPGCGEKDGFHQDYSVSGGIGIVYGSPTTLGQQAEMNAKKLGKERLGQVFEAPPSANYTGKLPKGARIDTTLPETPFWRDGSIEGTKKLDKPLAVEKLPDLRRYIESGK